MSKKKIFVSDVVACAGNLEVVFALIEDGEQTREVQICLPKDCGISKCIGEEIYYELKNGRVRITAVRPPKAQEETESLDAGNGEA